MRRKERERERGNEREETRKAKQKEKQKQTQNRNEDNRVKETMTRKMPRDFRKKRGDETRDDEIT